MLSFSVVVPATDRPPTLARCTAAIERAAGATELIVVDGPPDLSAAAARNAGAERASGDVLVFVDSDVEIHPDALCRIHSVFDARPELTAVFGSYDDSPSHAGIVSAFRNLLHHHVHHAARGPAQTFWSGLGAVRREAFLAAGGFDAARYPYPSVEDIDLGVRLVADGARIHLDPTIQGTHHKAWTLPSMLFTDFARRGVPWVALHLRSGKVPTMLNLGWRHRLSAASCALAAVGLLTRRPGTSVASVLALVLLNRDFYALIARRRGVAQAVLGVGFHALHHMAGMASVPAGFWVHARERRGSAVGRDG